MTRYVVYGTETCIQCRICKRYFDEQGISYIHVNLADLDEGERKELLYQSQEAGYFSLPIVFDEEEQKFTSWREVC